MKAHIDGIVLEGTPDDIAQVIARLRTSIDLPKAIDLSALSSGAEAVVAAAELSPDKDLVSGVSKAFARRVLQRKELSKAQLMLISALASKHPSGISYEEIQAATGLAGAKLAGVLGGFKTRISATPGYVKDVEFFWWAWDEDWGGYKYFLANSAFEAAREAGIIK